MTKRKPATLENLLRQWQTMGPMSLSPEQHTALDKFVQEKRMSDTETVEDPYRTDHREVEIKKLTKQVADLTKERAEMISQRDQRYTEHQRQIEQIRANYASKLEDLEGSSTVRGFGKLMLAAFTILWLLVNSAALTLPVYAVMELHWNSQWLCLMPFSLVSWIFFYFHISSLSERT